MKRINIVSLFVFIGLMAGYALSTFGAVPPPPVNQNLGIDDTVFGEFAEEDCRVCHASGVPDRHHMLYGQPIPDPSVVPDSDSNGDGVADTTYACLNCHLEDTTGGIITLQVWRDCLLCHASTPHHVTAEAQSGNCVHCHGDLVDNPTGCKELVCAVAHSSAGTTRGVPIPGQTCTTEGTSGTECDGLRVCRDTTELCTSTADCQGTCSTAGTACSTAADCPATETCDGAIGAGTCSDDGRAYCGMYGGEDTCTDGHVIPTYSPSLVTPSRSEHAHVCEGTTDPCSYDTDCAVGTCSVTTTQECHVATDCPEGETCVGGVECVESEDIEAPGGCAYCHNADGDLGTLDPDSGVLVFDNHDTHHGARVHSGHSERCAWCHKAGYPHSVYGEEADHIRWCENCHGYESLHNIQTDSDNAANLGSIVVGGENPWYGHIGNNDDCWGCHGFTTAAAPGSGPLTPSLSGSDASVATSGYDSMVTLVGSTLTNLVGSYQWISDVSMTAADGSVVTLAADSVSNSEMAVTIPAATAPGNYDLRAVKGAYAASNPVVISVKPEVAIAGSSCNKKKGVLTVSGSGFGEKPAGTDAYINVQVNGQAVAITSWSDTQITASVSSCSNNAAITVNALMGSATSGSGGGKPDRPCNGKKCN